MKYKLYNIGCMPDSNININKTHENILKKVNAKKDSIKKTLNKIGLEFKGFSIYTPKTYNYEVDCLDIKIEIKDQKKIIAFMNAHKKYLDILYAENESYDGYIATTPKDTEASIKDIEANQGLDCILIKYILIDFNARIFKNIIQNSLVFEGVKMRFKKNEITKESYKVIMHDLECLELKDIPENKYHYNLLIGNLKDIFGV